jgi:hypothetical protein
MAKRPHVSLKTKLAAALLTMVRPDDTGNLVPVIAHEHAKKMSPEQIISLFNFDHYPIPHAHDGPAEPWNLVPRLIREHRVKTATRDTPAIRRVQRVAPENEAFRQRLLAKAGQAESTPKPKSKLKSRGFPKAPVGMKYDWKRRQYVRTP